MEDTSASNPLFLESFTLFLESLPKTALENFNQITEINVVQRVYLIYPVYHHVERIIASFIRSIEPEMRWEVPSSSFIFMDGHVSGGSSGPQLSTHSLLEPTQHLAQVVLIVQSSSHFRPKRAHFYEFDNLVSKLGCYRHQPAAYSGH